MSALHLELAGMLHGWLALAVLAAAVLVILWAYRRDSARLSRRQMAYHLALRLILVILLIGCLAEPVLSYRTSPQGENPVLVLVDQSQSMSLKDTPGRVPRIEAALEPFTGTKALAKQIERSFAVRYFSFDAGVRELKELSGLDPTGEMTLIGEAFAGAAQQCAGKDLTGVVLLTDGADQSALDTAAQARSLGAPVYVVAVGEVATAASENPDVAIADVAGERFMDVNVENELTVRLEQHGLAGKTVQVDLLHEGAALTSQSVDLTDAAQDVVLRFTPTETGKQVFEVVAQPLAEEEIVENNRRTFTSILSKKKLSVVYIEGTPRWEYKFLKRALQHDPAVSFTSFVRSKGDLFLRQGEMVEEGVIPANADAFAQFDLIVLGDVTPDALSSVQQAAIREVVLEKGKGFLLIPGALSIAGQGWAGTPLADIAPALPVPDQPPVSGDFSVRITPEGKEHPIFAGLDVGMAPALPACMVLGEPKPGASVLATHPFESYGKDLLPVCVVQFAGKGRSMSMAIDSTWRWRMNAGGSEMARSIHDQFWAQVIRWLTGSKEEAPEDHVFLAYTDRDYYEPGRETVLSATVHGSGTEGAEAQVTASIRMPSGGTMDTPLQYVAGSGGQYRVNLALTEPGAYEAAVSGEKDGVALGQDTAAFFIGQPYREFDRVAMNEPLLRSLVFETGGAFYTPDEAEAIPGDLVQSVSEKAQFVERRLGRTPPLYAILVLCAAAEWFLRKRRGLL